MGTLTLISDHQRRPESLPLVYMRAAWQYQIVWLYACAAGLSAMADEASEQLERIRP
jgi:hypothetical protein